MKVTPEEIKRRLELPLDDKIQWAIERYLDFVEVFGVDGVYSCFSGGKDSQMMIHIIELLHQGKMDSYLKHEYRAIYNLCVKGKQSPPKVFADTGLEYPEIRKHVKLFDNVVWVKPKMKFPDVVKQFGFAVASKDVAQKVSEILSTKSLKLFWSRLFGDSKGNGKLPKMWRKLLTAPFPVSDKCCDIFKKEPFHRYEKLTGKKPIVGTTVEESKQRRNAYSRTSCNSFDAGKEKCRAISIFIASDVWAFAEKFNIRFAEVYYDRIVNGVLVKALDRTGCMFCLFGIHLESKKDLNRFQKMSISHPRQYKFCIEELGIGKVLDFIGVDYKIKNGTQLDF
jgi:3'-phosphoadenosine 5'-phosphosulfate sulfotransferase (PAPS reductase)/FAD synthetase